MSHYILYVKLHFNQHIRIIAPENVLTDLFIWRITRIKPDIVEPGKDLALAEDMDKRLTKLAIAGAGAVKTPHDITTGMAVVFVTQPHHEKIFINLGNKKA